jgi:hypothetical protein
MADAFGVDLDAVRQTAAQLNSIRAALDSLHETFDALNGQAGSKVVENALHNFVSHSSDSRKALDGLLERASGLLQGLSEGTGAVDASLAGALVPAGPAPGGAAS